MANETALAILRSIACRADEHGIVRLEQSEIPFFLTTEGTQWLAQVSLGDDSYEITDHGREALGARSK